MGCRHRWCVQACGPVEQWLASTSAGVTPAGSTGPYWATVPLYVNYGSCVAERAPSAVPDGVLRLRDHPRDEVHRLWAAGFTRAVAGSLKKVQRCYEDALRIWPKLHGTIRVQMIVSAQGRVERASVAQDTLHSEPVACCLLDLMRALQAPATVEGGSYLLSYPFVFAPQRSADCGHGAARALRPYSSPDGISAPASLRTLSFDSARCSSGSVRCKHWAKLGAVHRDGLLGASG